jgi:DNA-binding XRE family transcriptional regulator
MQEVTKTVKQMRAQWAKDFKQFRGKHLLSQARLAELLGVSRRCVIYVEKGEVTPVLNTKRQFEQLKTRYERNGGR